MIEIPGYEGYLADEVGKIYSLRSGECRELTSRSHKGYRHVFVKVLEGGRIIQKKRPVHQLIVTAFHGPRPRPDYEVRHLDGNPDNNVPANLVWGSRRENVMDAINHGTHA